MNDPIITPEQARMSVLNKIVRAAARDAKRAVQLSKYASEHTSLDEWVLRDQKDEAPAFRKTLDQPIELADGNVYEPSTDIHDDLFLTSHSPGESKAKRREEVRPSHQFGRDILEEIVKTPEFIDMKPYTEGDKLTSSIATCAYVKTLDELMKSKALAEQAQQSQDLHEQEQHIAATQDAIDALREKAKDHIQKGEPVPGSIPSDMRGLIGQREDLAGQLATNAANVKPVDPTVVRAAAREAAENAAEKVEVWGQIAGAGAVDFSRTTPDEAIALTDQWMQIPDYKEFCKLLGRVVRDFRSEDARNVIGGNDEIVGVETGADLSRLLTTELMMLGEPKLRPTFMRGFADETLMQFETQGSEKASNGPGVLLIDMSGSMRTDNKALKAKAVAVGFVRLMHKRKRDAVVICFNAGVMWEHHFPKRAPLDMRVLLDLASLYPTGGTVGLPAVKRALHHVERSPGFKRADVLLVTDGSVSSGAADTAVWEKLRKLNVRSQGIAIAHDPGTTGYLATHCDGYITVDQLTDATADIVRAVS